MGDRGNIVIEQWGEESTPVVLYTHWQATNLPVILGEALAHQERWGDNEYLARIIADELSAISSEFTGCGIGTSVHGDTWRVINVDPNEQEVTFTDPNDYELDKHLGETYTFIEFVETFTPHLDSE